MTEVEERAVEALGWITSITSDGAAPDLWYGPASHLWFCEISGNNADDSLRMVRAEGASPLLAIEAARAGWDKEDPLAYPALAG